ncbi:hypothetical protein [Paraburkholderia adhaesiva]|uniref:hypothetical protein n=1 Tax=Paraburkholderia adhaesiva TaxID=2883244 RepID=UPI001F4653F3|nr:hypothetical protein [Paraburkholderia adhaesiva]
MKLTTTYLLTLRKQGVFNFVAEQLLHQNARAMAPGTAKCMYRAPDGRRCAIGWLMPDEVYRSRLEYIGVNELASELLTSTNPEHFRFAEFLLRHMWLLRELQGLHDAHTPDAWPVRLRMIAAEHRLDTFVIDHMAPVMTLRQERPTDLLQRTLAPYISDHEPEAVTS